MSSNQTTRFWSKVTVGQEHECWPFLGARSGGRDGDSYGVFRTRLPRKQVYAHRFAYCVANGINIHELPPKVVIRHDCDNTICCNPSHLQKGSQSQNANDMVARGRSTRGTKNSMHILTDGQVIEIRARISSGEFHSSIAADYGVSRAAVTLISSGKRWAWLLQPCNDNLAEDSVSA